MLGMNSKQIALTVGTLFIFSGLFGLVGSKNDLSVPEKQQNGNSKSVLEVKRGNNLPASTINYLQGSGGLQGQGAQPQNSNSSGRLQPNAGADSLPKNY